MDYDVLRDILERLEQTATRLERSDYSDSTLPVDLTLAETNAVVGAINAVLSRADNAPRASRQGDGDPAL